MSNESRNKFLIKNTALFAIGNMGTKLINFLMVPLYTYSLSTEQYGTINTTISICSIIIPFVMCNIGEAVRRYLLDKESDPNAVQSVEIIWFSFGMIISILMYCIFHRIPQWKTYALEMSLYTLLNAFAGTTLDYLRGKEKLQIYTACGIFQTFMIALLNIIFIVKFDYGIKGYFWSYITSYFITGIIAFLAGEQLKDLKKIHFDQKMFLEMSRFALMLVPNSVMWWVTNSSDRLMITYMISAAANGIYSVSYKMPTIMSTLSTILMQAWQHSAIRENDSQDRTEYNNIMYKSYMCGTFIVGAMLLLINRPFMQVYVAPEYREAWRYSPFLIVSSIFSTLGTFVGTSYYVEKDMKGNLRSATIGAIMNVLLNCILIPKIGATGAAVATCISYVTVFLYRARDTRKYMPIKVYTSTFWKLLAAILFMLASSFVSGIAGFLLLLLGTIFVLIFTKDFWYRLLSKILRKNV